MQRRMAEDGPAVDLAKVFGFFGKSINAYYWRVVAMANRGDMFCCVRVPPKIRLTQMQ